LSNYRWRGQKKYPKENKVVEQAMVSNEVTIWSMDIDKLQRAVRELLYFGSFVVESSKEEVLFWARKKEGKTTS